MLVEPNYPLQAHNSFGILAKAHQLVRVQREADVLAVLADPALCGQAKFVLGGGSNIVLTGDVKIGIVRQRAPSDLRQHLMLTAQEYGGDYEIFRQRIDEYWRAVGPLGGQELPK